MATKSARIYDFTLPAGGSFQLPVEGDYVRIMTATGVVELVTDNYRLGPINAGQGQDGEPFKRLTINDKSGAGNVGTILVANSGFVDQRISGEVSVIDGEKFRVLASQYFSGSPVSLATAAQYGACQLWNPAGSTKRLIVKSSGVSVSAASPANYYPVNAPLLNSQPSRLYTKLAGSLVAASAEVRSASNVALITGSTMYGFQASANVYLEWLIKGAIVLPPGTGLNVECGLPNATLQANFEWFEEAA